MRQTSSDTVKKAKKTMTDLNTTVVTEVTPKKAAAKKAVKKVVKKTVTKTTTTVEPKGTKKAAKVPTEKKERVKKEGLRKAQITILSVLSKSKKPMTRTQIAELATTVDKTKVGDYAGPRSENQTEKAAAKWNFPNLYELDYVTCAGEEGVRGWVYEITPKGREALKEALKNAE